MTAQEELTTPAGRDALAMHSALWADQYALTMAQAFFTHGKHDLITSFHCFIRKNPFAGGYLITAGQNILFDWLEHWHFDASDIELLRGMHAEDPDGGQQHRLFTDAFLDMLASARLQLNVDAMPEGELAFPDEPIVRVYGPLWQCLLVESALLNIINSQSLFATLASRLMDVAEGGAIIEFGLRRAQALGGLESSRATYIGGVNSTSNLLAAKYYGIPTAGTFAHALVMVYEDELEAFRDYAGAMPYNGIFLVDTYATESGVRHAVEACRNMGVRMKGIRLDSGDLAYLSRIARHILDEAGFGDALVAASNDLDEDTVASLRRQGAKIDIWGIGTNLSTSKAQPALGAVYKLGAIFDGGLSRPQVDARKLAITQGHGQIGDLNGFVREVIKISEQQTKITIPGELDVLRYLKRENEHWRFDGDTIISTLQPDPVTENSAHSADHPARLTLAVESVQKYDETLRKVFPAGTPVYRPIRAAFVNGERTIAIENVHQARARARNSMDRLHPTHKRLKNPHIYATGLEASLYDKRHAMIMSLRHKLQN